jgi:deoxyribose-phosphate aldolase
MEPGTESKLILGIAMDAYLEHVASEALRRLEEAPLPAGSPQLLACLGDRCLLRTSQGLLEVPAGRLPEHLDLSPLVDHTLLKPEARMEDMDRLCEEALEFRFASVCVNPLWVARCAASLQGSAVRTCAVVGFPLGASTPHMKVAEAREAFRSGAQELDMVLSVGQARGGEWEAVRRELGQIRGAVPEAVLKLILETCLLSDPEKVEACRIAAAEGFDFVKTSTGFSSGGATEADVALLRKSVRDKVGVKASGGIRTYQAALGMVLAGATRLGLSASKAVIEGAGG